MKNLMLMGLVVLGVFLVGSVAWADCTPTTEVDSSVTATNEALADITQTPEFPLCEVCSDDKNAGFATVEATQDIMASVSDDAKFQAKITHPGNVFGSGEDSYVKIGAGDYLLLDSTYADIDGATLAAGMDQSLTPTFKFNVTWTTPNYDTGAETLSFKIVLT